MSKDELLPRVNPNKWQPELPIYDVENLCFYAETPLTSVGLGSHKFYAYFQNHQNHAT